MLDICLLGTGGMMPLPGRYLTSLYVRFNGNGLLIDCGEGTQIAMHKKGLSAHNINTILLTHFHADHVSGLPGMLLTMGNGDRTEPVKIIGPKGLDRILTAVRTIAPELPFSIEMQEIEGNADHFSIDGMEIDAFKVQHNLICYGYSIEVHRQGKFDVERAKAQDIPQMLWNPLQKGQTIEQDGRTFTPDMVLGPERKGLKVVYSTDTRPAASITQYGQNADLMILEGMYGEDDKQEKAKQYRHMTMREAARIAQKAQPKEMWLTHFSPSVVRPDVFADDIRKIFPATVFPKDGRDITLRFEES